LSGVAKDEENMSTIPLDDQEIRYQISQIRELPPLPQSLLRLIEIIHNEVESADELESLILYDQALTAKMLRMANSTYYGCRGKVKNVSRAIVLIGINQAKSICLCALFMNLFSNGHSIDPFFREYLWKHAFATSKIAVEMTKKRPWLNREDAAVLGLTHDIGYLVMATYFREHFNSIMEIASSRKCPAWCVEMQIGLSHTQLGKYLASRWAFPEQFQAVIEYHHSPDRSRSYQAEVKLIHLANVLSNSLHYPELLTDAATLSCCGELHISEEEWQEYQDGLELIWPQVDQLWNLLK
jgi:putative nucleotidyltransferase with HDIG domain